MADMTEHEYKMQFATLLQRVPKLSRPQHAALVAKEVFGAQAYQYPTYVLTVADEWQFDPVVIAEITRLDLIPDTKEEWLQVVRSTATDKFTDAKERIQAMRLYAEMNGWIQRQNTTLKDEGAKGGITDDERALSVAVLNPIQT